jgi:hypothetical protein
MTVSVVSWTNDTRIRTDQIGADPKKLDDVMDVVHDELWLVRTRNEIK